MSKGSESMHQVVNLSSRIRGARLQGQARSLKDTTLQEQKFDRIIFPSFPLPSEMERRIRSAPSYDAAESHARRLGAHVGAECFIKKIISRVTQGLPGNMLTISNLVARRKVALVDDVVL